MSAPEESGVYSVIWDRPERAAKGPAPAYSRAAIAAAAVAIADSDGAEGVSMRRIAAALGTGATSLYRYVTSKDELLDLMIDSVEGEEGVPELTGDWREDLISLASRMRGVIRQHPWMATIAAGRPNLGPNRLVLMERGLAALDPLDLDIDEQLVIMMTIEAFVRGYALSEFAEEEGTLRSGVTVEQWMASYSDYMRTIIEEGLHPHVARVVIDATGPHAPDRVELGFARGLGRILNGIAADL
ncbi:MAG: TetR/AcrR family transcriptional regulator [Acidimicrobiales bacterium]